MDGRAVISDDEDEVEEEEDAREVRDTVAVDEGDDDDEEGDEKDGTKGAATKFSLAISRRDIGTQMSPVQSPNSSPKAASGSSVLPIAELQSNHPSKLDVKDVQVDDHVTVAKRSKKHGAQGLDKCSTNNRERKKKVAEPQASDWEVVETEKCISKYSPVLHHPHRFSATTTRGNTPKESSQERFAVGQGLDGRWIREGDRKHGVKLRHNRRRVFLLLL